MLSQQKNRQIIDAAIEEFLEHGFVGGRMDRIAERARVSKRTVYKHFRSKEVLFDAMIEHMLDGFRSAQDIIYNPKIPFESQLRAIAVAEGKLFTSVFFMKLTRLMSAEIRRDPRLASKIPPEQQGESPVLVQFFKDARTHGVLKAKDCRLASEQFRGLLKVRAFWPVLNGEPILTRRAMTKVINDSIAMFLSHYGT